MVKKIFFFLGIFCVLTMWKLGYVGIAILMGIESACIPLPSELIMPYAGAMTIPAVNAELVRQYSQFGVTELPQFNLVLAGLAGAIGCNLGSEVAYWVAAKGGRPLIEKYGRYVLLSKHELEIADRWFDKRGDIIILVARLLPIIRTFIAFPAGLARMNRVKFHVYTFVGSLPWCLALGYVGQKLGIELTKETSPLKAFMHKFDVVIAAVVILGGIWFVRSRIKAFRQYRKDDAEAAEKAATGTAEKAEKAETAKADKPANGDAAKKPEPASKKSEKAEAKKADKPASKKSEEAEASEAD